VLQSASAHRQLAEETPPSDAQPASAAPASRQRLGAQARMFLHMHARLKQSQAYRDFKAGLPLKSPRSHHSGAPIGSGVGGKADGSEGVPHDVDVDGLGRLHHGTLLEPHEYADYARDLTSPPAAHSGGGHMQGKNRQGSRHSADNANTLSEESNFRYDPCTQDYTVGKQPPSCSSTQPILIVCRHPCAEYLNDAKVQEALHVRYIPGTEPHESHSPVADAAQPADASPDAHIGTHDGPTIARRAPNKGRFWNYCSDPVNGLWAFNDYLGDTTALYKSVYTHKHKPRGFKMLVYSGDVDGVSGSVAMGCVCGKPCSDPFALIEEACTTVAFKCFYLLCCLLCNVVIAVHCHTGVRHGGHAALDLQRDRQPRHQPVQGVDLRGRGVRHAAG
jgi:hypothetical protein